MRVILAGAATVLLVVSLFLLRPAALEDLDSKVCDVLTGWAGPGEPSKQVVIVEIDERTLGKFGRWPWPRDLLAQLTRGIVDSGAATVVLDMMFPQEDPGNDKTLVEALSGRPVVAGYTLVFDGAGSPSACNVPPLPLALVGPDESPGAVFFHATGVICNSAALSDAVAASGFLNAAPDHDGVTRHIPLVIESNHRYYPSIALAAFDRYRHVSSMQLLADEGGARFLRLDGHSVPTEGRSLLRLRFRGAARKFPYVSAADILSGSAPAELLKGRIAIVGGSAAGLRGAVVTPADPLYPGVEVQATAIDNLVQGDSLEHPGAARFWELFFAVVVGSASTLVLARRPSLWGTLLIAGVGAGVWAACELVLSGSRMLLSPLPATAVLACNVPAIFLINYFVEKNRADRAQQELAATMQRSIEGLRASESRYQRLVDNVSDAIVVDDVSGRLVFANRRFHEWFGLQDADIANITLEKYVAPEWCAEVRARHERRMRGEAVPDHFEFEGIRSDGTHIWIEALVATVEENGKVVGTQAALRDTTERKRIEAQSLQARKMETVGRLAGGVAHDFNNLLTVINAYSDLLLSDLPPGHPSRNPLEQIRIAGDRAAELTKKLLAFSRKQMVQPRPVNLNLIVAESKRMLERVIGEDIELVTRLTPDLGYVIADPGQIHQALMNLLVNARDAMPHGGRVIIDTRNVELSGTGDSFVYLAVTDFGTGMSDDVKQHLYEPFFTTKGPGKGTGLGLATVYGIVQQIGGRIEAASALEKGTTFHIYLPRVKPPLAEQAHTPAVPVALAGSETVLVVEDQDAVRQLATTILRNYGYHVLEASNGPDAITLAERYPGVIHLLVTDIIMPLMDGRVLAEKLKAVRPDMNVLYVSGYSEEQIGRSRAIDSGLAYLTKPFTAEVLATRVREVLAEGGNQSRTASTE